MKLPLVQLPDQPIGEGKERVCYLHPDDARRVIKLQKTAVRKQTDRELRLYRSLQQRGLQDYSHLPRYHGTVDTNLGPGNVFDLVANYDGEISRSLWWYFTHGYPLGEFIVYLEVFREYLLRNRIVFSNDMSRYNLLFQKISPTDARLVVIDGIGNHTALNWLDNIPVLARSKIQRRWQRFMSRLEHYANEANRSFDGPKQQLDAAYRKPG